MAAFTRFFNAIQQDFKAFIYWCFIFSIFRGLFIFMYASQIGTTGSAKVLEAMFLGLRLSLKTAGILTLIGVVFASLPYVVYKKYPVEKVRIRWHSIALLFFSICFFARIPYYQIFNSGFNIMLINGMYDDKYAILMTAIHEYHLLWLLPLAIITGCILAKILSIVLKTPIIDFGNIKHKKIVAVCTIILLPIICVFVRYGGAFNYASSINWESAARLKSNLLNEAILDDGQALYRVHSLKKKLDKASDVNISEDTLREKIALLGGNPKADSIDSAFVKTVDTPKMAKQPSTIVVIVGESFGLFPFLPAYENLGLVNETLRLQNSDSAISTDIMLSNGTGTIEAVSGLVTGLPAAGLHENYQANSFSTKYKTGIGYIMKQLSYKTVFWYGGFSEWQNIRKFVLAQNFDEFHCASDFSYEGGNAWGCPDKVLFENINKYIANQGNEKVLHVVLTSSNHPPYTINVANEGFDKEKVKSILPDDISKDDATLNELGHIWYADQAIGEFVKKAEQQKPDSLFVITGDHSERFTFAKEQDLKTLSAIPCIYYGQGIDKNWLSHNKIGCQMQIAGTLAELVGYRGFSYSAMLPNMFSHHLVFNHRLYVEDENQGIALISKNKDVQTLSDAARQVAAWRVLKENE